MASAALTLFEDIQLGQVALFSVHLTEELVNNFCSLSGDENPLHMDETYAKQTSFEGRVVHGQLGVCYFSQLIGMHLPGQYALYLSQSTFFRAPMRIGMEVIVRGEVLQKSEAMRTLVIKTQILEKTGSKVLIEGEALVKMLK